MQVFTRFNQKNIQDRQLGTLIGLGKGLIADGLNSKGVTKALNYLVIGSYVTDSWAHESFGRKIEKAMDYRAQGMGLAKITEEYWANEAAL